MIFYIPSTKHLAESINLPKGSCLIKQFSDGEWHVTVQSKVHNKPVWVLAQTGAPADSMIQLLLLCDALKRSGAQLNLLISYFGYARQDKTLKGEALASEVMLHLLALAKPQRVEVIHLHNPEILRENKPPFFRSLIQGVPQYTISNHIPYKFFYEQAHSAEIIVAPDKGARSLAQHIAEHTGKEALLLEKHRPEPEKVVLSFSNNVQGKRVLIVDDMITTGSTVLNAAQVLHAHGAKIIRVAATHGIFSGNAIDNINSSIIEHVWVSNTLEQKHSSQKITVSDIGLYLESLLKY